MSRALDPQLHTHVVAANLARGPDGRFTALHATELYRAAKTAGYLYQAHLRALVTERLGLEWGPVRKGAAELADIDRPVVEHFSQRRHEMVREAERGGIGLGSKSAAEHAALATTGAQAVRHRDAHVARGGQGARRRARPRPRAGHEMIRDGLRAASGADSSSAVAWTSARSGIASRARRV